MLLYPIYFRCLFFLLFLLLTACEQVVDLDLETASPQLVVAGSITDATGPYTVKLSKTGAYFGSQQYEQVRGATVVIADNAGQQETLTETSPGTYQTNTLQGVPGRTYTLSVLAAGISYTAQSTMPYPVFLESLELEYEEAGFMEDVDGNTAGYVVTAHLEDPAGIKNYYRFRIFLNGEPKDDQIYLLDDDLSDGKRIAYDLMDNYAQSGQIARVEMQCLNKTTHDYYNTLSNITGGGDGFSDAVPDNPKSNLTNGAQGYFAAYTTSIQERDIAE